MQIADLVDRYWIYDWTNGERWKQMHTHEPQVVLPSAQSDHTAPSAPLDHLKAYSEGMGLAHAPRTTAWAA